MKTLNEALAALTPEYPVNIAGKDFTLRFDVNINKTKKGIKLQFMSNDLPNDVRQKQQLTNEIGTELQTKFGDVKLQVILDLENPYENIIGFLIPLPSIANHIMELAFPEAQQAAPKKKPEEEEQPEQAPEEEPAAEPLPSQEQPPSEEDETMKEIMMWRAGLRF